LDPEIQTHNFQTFSISDENAGERLDAFLANHIEGWSRARLQQLIEDGEVLVNGRAIKSSYKLRANDQIEVELTPSPVARFVAEDIPIEEIGRASCRERV